MIIFLVYLLSTILSICSGVKYFIYDQQFVTYRDFLGICLLSLIPCFGLLVFFISYLEEYFSRNESEVLFRKKQ